MTVTSGDGRYPDAEEEEAALSDAGVRRYLIPAMRIAQEVGQARVNNVVMLGAASALGDVPVSIWRDVISERVPERFVALNERAFAAGREWMERERH